jgi:hypothetical protein
MTEAQYQSKLIRKLKTIFPGCMIMKLDSQYQQGVPDLLILYNDTWAILEVKIDATSPVQPNQDYYINHLSNLSFASYIYPDNEKEVLSALQQAFKSSGRARVLES